jgi:hypothetical protein
MATQRLTTRERNYQNNSRDIDSTIAVFRKTDNIERLVVCLSQLLSPNEFRMLFATEFANVPLNVVFVDSNGNTIDEENN